MLEAVTHRLRTDISALQVIAEGVLAVPFEDDERPQVRAEVGEVGADAQRRLSAVREVMISLHPGAPREPEPLIETLERELEGAGVAIAVEPVARRAAGGARPRCRLVGVRAVAGRGAGLRHAAGRSADRRARSPGRLGVTAGEVGGEPLAWTERVARRARPRRR